MPISHSESMSRKNPDGLVSVKLYMLAQGLFLGPQYKHIFSDINGGNTLLPVVYPYLKYCISHCCPLNHWTMPYQPTELALAAPPSFH